MNQYAGTLIVCVCLGAAAFGAACDSGSDGGGSAGATATAGAAPAAGAGPTAGAGPAAGAGPTAGAGPSAGAGGGTVAGTAVPIDPDATGFVSAPALGIQGAWYAYGDGMGPDGMAASGNCIAKGMHMAAECSSVTTPPFGKFENVGGKMCTSGTVAKVINLTTGTMKCPTLSTDCDYSNMFGAGIGLDLNNAGADGGMGKMPFNATAANIIGISFNVEMLPLTGLRVEFPTVDTADTAAIYKPQSKKNYTSPLVEGPNTILFTDVIQPDYIKPPQPLDATKIVSIQFHVPTSPTASATYSFCISGMSVITK